MGEVPLTSKSAAGIGEHGAAALLVAPGPHPPPCMSPPLPCLCTVTCSPQQSMSQLVSFGRRMTDNETSMRFSAGCVASCTVNQATKQLINMVNSLGQEPDVTHWTSWLDYARSC